MTDEELRAFALIIAELNHPNRFFNIRNSKIQLNERHRRYLKAIEQYIANDTYEAVSDNGIPEFSELTPSFSKGT